MMRAQSTPLPLAWLHVLVACTFCQPCQCNNGDRDKMMKTNHFCKDCLRAMCYYCAHQHIMHSVLRIHRYWYNNVVYVANIQKYVNVVDIQTYNLYNGKVIHIKAKGSQSSVPGGRSNLPDDSIPCTVCSQIIKVTYKFCSVECKLKQWHLDKQANPASNAVSWYFPAVEPVHSGGLKIIIKNQYAKKQGELISAALPASPQTMPLHFGQLKKCPKYGPHCSKLKGTPMKSPHGDTN